MFGEKATAHVRIVEQDEALRLTGQKTLVVATRVSHDRLARAQLPHVAPQTARYATLTPGTTALHLHYRGPQVGEAGELPVGGMVTYYLIEVEAYQEADIG